MKKVIKQSYQTNIEVESFTVNNITISQHNTMTSDEVVVEKSKSREIALTICPELETEKIEFADQCLNDVLNKLLTGRIKVPKHSNGIAEFVTNYLTSTTNGK